MIIKCERNGALASDEFGYNARLPHAWALGKRVFVLLDNVSDTAPRFRTWFLYL